MSEPEIRCETRGRAGHVLLNRPAALNALTHGMVRELAAALDRWEHDPAVTRVVVEGAGERAFCAGGDIRRLFDARRAGDVSSSLAFWRDEYRLNLRIARYPKPYVALVDGIVMGGGVGVSWHGSHRVAGDRYSFAMPEVGIGFFPDVGATFVLPRLPGAVGTFLALTGARVGPDDAVSLGLATHRVPSDRFAAVAAALTTGGEVGQVLAEHAVPPADGPLGADRDVIDRCFSAPSVPAILDRLDREAATGSAFAAKTAAAIRTKAPSSLLIAFEQMKRGRAMTLEDAMAAEFRIASRVAAAHDFYEGIRAAIVDKDGAPRWRPDRLDALPPDFAASHFAPLPGGDLEDDPV